MNTRTNITSRHQQPSRSHSRPHPTSSTPPLSLSRTTSQPGTPTHSRGDLPSRKSSSSSRHRPPQLMPDPPTTPKPTKSGRRKRGGAPASTQRNENVDVAGDNAPRELYSEDDEMLFDLLGVTSPPPPSKEVAGLERGLLPVSKSDRETPRRKGRGRKEAVQSEPERKEPVNVPRSRTGVGSPSPSVRKGRPAKEERASREVEKGVTSEGEPVKKKGRGAGAGRPVPQSSNKLNPSSSTPATPQLSGTSTTRPPKAVRALDIIPNTAFATNEKTAFDLSSLSRSLPTGGFFAPPPKPQVGNGLTGKNRRKGPDSEDESLVWEMPDGVASSGSQELTWQQKLQNSQNSQNSNGDALRRSTRSTPADRKTKPRSITHVVPPNPTHHTPRPPHTRQLSLDGESHTSTTRSFSAFDSAVPYHTGLNANRAPQTPVKLPTAMVPGSTLPIVGSGEFPRLNQGNKGPLAGLTSAAGGAGGGGQGGAKYAGPTFHNSPHAATLPKPDLEDF